MLALEVGARCHSVLDDGRGGGKLDEVLVLSEHLLLLFELVVNLEGLVGHLQRFFSGLDTSLLQELTLLTHVEGSWFRARP